MSSESVAIKKVCHATFLLPEDDLLDAWLLFIEAPQIQMYPRDALACLCVFGFLSFPIFIYIYMHIKILFIYS